ncbi:MAG: prepilin peptidase [Vicinamibacterales bacterium]
MTDTTVLTIIFVVLGAMIGSFLNVCIYRIPLGTSIVWPASACESCARELSWYENLPLVSWIALGGKCRTCRTPLSIRHPIVEGLTAAMFGFGMWYYGPTLQLAAQLVFGCALIVLFAIDLEHHLLPNVITLPGIVVGLAFSIATGPGWLASVIGIVLGGGSLSADRGGLLPRAPRGRARHGRREDAGDDWRVRRLEADARHADDGVGRWVGRGTAADCRAQGRHEVRAAVRDVPRDGRCARRHDWTALARLVHRALPGCPIAASLSADESQCGSVPRADGHHRRHLRDADVRRIAHLLGGASAPAHQPRGRLREQLACRRTAGCDRPAARAGARDCGPRRGVGTPEQRDHSEPRVRSARRGTERRHPDRQPGRTSSARTAGKIDERRLPCGARRADAVANHRRVPRERESHPAAHRRIFPRDDGRRRDWESQSRRCSTRPGRSTARCACSPISPPSQQLEEQLRLKQSLATVGELTAGIAHEFRNGLATIHGYSRLLNPELLPEQARPYVEGIRAEAISLGEIVTNFLNFAKPAQLALSDVDLRALCARVADEARDDAKKLGGDVRLVGEFGVMQGDEVLLRQAFDNLLRNAVEACAGASTVPDVVVEGSVDNARGTCTINFDDNGPGVPPASRERIFQPFLTSKKHGTGLGLALVQKIVVSHNGRVTVGSAPLGGARLQVVLPII